MYTEKKLTQNQFENGQYHTEGSQRGGPRSTNPKRSKTGKSPETRERPLRQGSRPQRQAKNLGDRAAVDPESHRESGERTMGTESPVPLSWGLVHGDRRPWTGEAHRNRNKDVHRETRVKGGTRVGECQQLLPQKRGTTGMRQQVEDGYEASSGTSVITCNGKNIYGGISYNVLHRQTWKGSTLYIS